MKKLFRLLMLNKTTAEVLIYGYIGEEESASVIRAIQEANDRGAKTVRLRINSKGGDVFDGMAIYNAMRRSEAEIHTYNDGVAASMASVILVGGHKVFMSENAKIMIHQPSSFAGGQSDDLKRIADLMDQMKEEFAAIYANKTGKETDWITSHWLQHGVDNWFSAAEAKEHNLIDEVVDGDVTEPEADGLVKIAAHYQEELTRKFSNQNQNSRTMLKALINALIGVKLGGAPVVTLGADATEADVVNGITQLGGKLIELNGKLAEKDSTIASLEKQITDLKDSQADDRAKNLVNLAKSEGKITADEVDNYVELAKSNYEATEKILKEKKPIVSIRSMINSGGSPTEAEKKILAMDWDAASKENKLETIKAKFPERYIEIFEAKFEKKPNLEVAS